MKKISGLWMFVCLVLVASLLNVIFPAKGQVVVGNQTIAITFSAPSGSCSSTQSMQELVPNGTLYSCQNGTWGTVGGGSLPAGLTFSVPTLTISAAGSGNGQLALSGNTSGTATFTAPAIAGTSTNAVVMSNVIQGPNGTAASPSFQVGAAGVGLENPAGSGNLGLVAGSAEVLRITGSGNTNFISGNAGFGGTKGQHFFNQAANSDSDSQCTLSSGTCTFNFTTAFGAAPICNATVTTTGTFTTGAALKIATATGSYTVTSTTGTDSAVINVHCAANGSS